MTSAPHPASAFDDPVARQIPWLPVSDLDQTAATHALVRDGLGRWGFRVKQSQTQSTVLITSVLGIAGLVFLAVSGIMGAESLHTLMTPALFIAVFPLLLALIVVLSHVQNHVLAVVDGRRRTMWRPRVADGEPWVIAFEDVHAFQVLWRSDDKDVAEMNIVSRSAERLHVITQGGADGVLRDARRIANLLDVPVWETHVDPSTKEQAPDRDTFDARSERYLRRRSHEIGGPVTLGRDMRAHLLTPSGIVLVLANLGPLAGVMFWHWPVVAVFAAYWFENAVVGILGALRLTVVIPGSEAGRSVKTLAVPFFVLHYGLFVWLHGVLVMGLFGRSVAATATPWDLGPLVNLVLQPPVLYAIPALAISHAASFAWNYIKKEEYARADLAMLMAAPYVRVGILHVVLVAGVVVAPILGTDGVGLALLVAVKIVADLFAHLVEHGTPLMAADRSKGPRPPHESLPHTS